MQSINMNSSMLAAERGTMRSPLAKKVNFGLDVDLLLAQAEQPIDQVKAQNQIIEGLGDSGFPLDLKLSD